MHRSPRGPCNRCGLIPCRRGTHSASPSSTRRIPTRPSAARQTAQAARQRRCFPDRAAEAEAAKARPTNRPTRNPPHHPHPPRHRNCPTSQVKARRWMCRRRRPIPQSLRTWIVYKAKPAFVFRTPAHVQIRCNNTTPLFLAIKSTPPPVREMNRTVAIPLRGYSELRHHRVCVVSH